jgi:hypothetical protein
MPRWLLSLTCTLAFLACAAGLVPQRHGQVDLDDDDIVITEPPRVCRGAGGPELDTYLQHKLGYGPVAWGVKDDKMMLAWPIPTIDSKDRVVFVLTKRLGRWAVEEEQFCDEKSGVCKPVPLVHCEYYEET